jgi:ASPIC and UnbV
VSRIETVGASPLQQHIGLGKAARIVSVEVFWPTSKTRQVFSGVEKDQFLEIKELENKYIKLDRKPLASRSPHSPGCAPRDWISSRDRSHGSPAGCERVAGDIINHKAVTMAMRSKVYDCCWSAGRHKT